MVKRFAHDRIPAPPAHLNLFRPPYQQIQRESHRTETAHFPDLGQAPPPPRSNREGVIRHEALFSPTCTRVLALGPSLFPW